VEFEVDQWFAASADQVMATFCDPDFYQRLGQLDRIHPPAVVDHAVDGAQVHLAVRYRAAVDLPGAARRFVRDDLLSWVEHSELDLGTGRGSFRIVPDHYRHLLDARGRVSHDADRGGSVRRLTGSVRIRVPIVGRRAETVVIDGLREQVGAASAIVEQWLEEQG